MFWDQKLRAKLRAVDDDESLPGIWHLTQCTFNPTYYELDPSHYPEDLVLIGQGTPRGTQGKVKL